METKEIFDLFERFEKSSLSEIRIKQPFILKNI